MSSEDSNKDSREYLKEVVRSNGRTGSFWARGESVCVQLRHLMYGEVRFLIDPLAFNGRGCIYNAFVPKHMGDPFGWRKIDFSEFVRMMEPSMSAKLSSIGRRTVHEARTFAGSSHAPSKRSLGRSHHAIADKAPVAASDVVHRIQKLTDELMLDGHETLWESIKKRGMSESPLLFPRLISLFDLTGEASLLLSLHGDLIGPKARTELENAISSVKSEMNALSESLENHSLDVTLLNLTLDLLIAYIISLHRLTSKSLLLPALNPVALTAFSEEISHSLLEPRTMAENIFEASRIIGHPPDLTRWIAEFRFYDYALRELLSKVYSTAPESMSYTTDISVFHRDRFAYSPEIAWWMWLGFGKEVGKPLDEMFSFRHDEVAEKTGIRSKSSDEVLTNVRPDALIGKEVEILIVDTPFSMLQGIVLSGLKVQRTAKSELDEGGYFVASLQEPITLSLSEELSYPVKAVRFGSALPRSPPQAMIDKSFYALMGTNPYKRLIVDLSISQSDELNDSSSNAMHIGYGILGMVGAMNASIFEIQQYRLVEDFIEEMNAKARAWDIDYRG